MLLKTQRNPQTSYLPRQWLGNAQLTLGRRRRKGRLPCSIGKPSGQQVDGGDAHRMLQTSLQSSRATSTYATFTPRRAFPKANFRPSSPPNAINAGFSRALIILSESADVFNPLYTPKGEYFRQETRFSRENRCFSPVGAVWRPNWGQGVVAKNSVFGKKNLRVEKNGSSVLRLCN